VLFVLLVNYLDVKDDYVVVVLMFIVLDYRSILISIHWS